MYNSCTTLGTVAFQAPLSMGFTRQEYWSGLPRPPPEDLPNPGIEPAPLMSPILAGGFFTTVTPVIQGCVCKCVCPLLDKETNAY